MYSAWLAGDFPVTQAYGCTDFLAEGPDPRHPECAAFHNGIDLGVGCGHPIWSQVNGHVVQRGVYGGGPNALIIRSGNWDIWLLHMQAASVNVGDSVSMGQHIADVGTMGFSTGCHLHFQVNPAGGSYRTSVDPTAWLSGTVPFPGTSQDASSLSYYVQESSSMGYTASCRTFDGQDHIFFIRHDGVIVWVNTVGGAGGFLGNGYRGQVVGCYTNDLRELNVRTDIGPLKDGVTESQRIILMAWEGDGQMTVCVLDPTSMEKVNDWSRTEWGAANPGRVPTYETEYLRL